MNQPIVDDLITQLNSLSSTDRKKVVAGMTSGSYCGIIHRSKIRRARKKNGGRKLLWHGILVDFKNTSYIATPQDVWRLDSLLGARKLNRAVKLSLRLDSEFVENLFVNVPFSVYVNEDETFLFSVKNELTEADFGPLRTIKPIEALKRFGLEALETAKEKGYVHLPRQ